MVDKKDTKMLLDYWKPLIFMKHIEEELIWDIYKGGEKTLLIYHLFN